MIYKLSRPPLMGSTGNLGKLNDDDLIVKTRYIMKISSNLDINIFGYSSLSNLDHENILKQIYNN